MPLGRRKVRGVTAVLVLGSLALAAWVGLLLHPARPWDVRPVGEDEPEAPAPERWPSVAVLVPARNEATVLPQTLPALLAQDYPGRWSVVLVDDRSGDGTAAVALTQATGPLTVVEGSSLPPGWVGKPWALEQALSAATRTDYLLLTDADIRHAPSSLRRLVAQAEAGGLALVSRMARLRCVSFAERLLVPPFLFFFQCLYPMRRVNDPRARVAAAAGGCILVRRDALERAGGFAAIQDAVIDDIALARRIKGLPEPIRLVVSRSDAVSARPHDSIGSVWHMVSRTAFTQLRRSRVLLALTLAGLALLFPFPAALLLYGLASGSVVPAALGGAAWVAMTLAFFPTIRFFGLPRWWSATLSIAGVLYAGMTLDSALRSSS
jgi:hopene-associated glycosyltransferase HpnB